MADLDAGTPGRVRLPIVPAGGTAPQEAPQLVVITVVLVGLTVLHDLDHLRQGRVFPAVLYLVAVAALASLAATLTVVLRYPRWARLAAVAQGVATVLGVGAVHVAPNWSPFTDSYGSAGADTTSWAIIIAMMVAGCALALSAALSRPAAALRND